MDTPAQAPAAAPQAPQSADMRGVPDPVARIQAILSAEQPQQAPAAKPQAQQEQPSAQPAQPEEPEAPAGPNAQVEADDAPPEDAPATAEIPLDQLEAIAIDITVKGDDGKDITEKRTIKELREGSMRQADYSRKTAELARQREQLREETRKAADAERVKYVTELQTLHDLVVQTAVAELGNVDWNDLATNNAFEYVKLDNRRKQITSTLEGIRTKQQEVLTKHRTDQETARREQASKAIQQLEQEIPGWNDVKYQELMKVGIEKFGYKQEEITSLVDPRVFKLIHKAHLYDQMQAEKTPAAPGKRVVQIPKVVRPGTPAVTPPAQQREANAMKQLRTSGKLDDAAAVLRQRDASLRRQ